jgi:transposase
MGRRRSPAKVKPAQMMQLIMQVRGGMLSATEAAAQLGISRKTWYERESRAMTAMMEALEAQPPGRPSSQADPETEKLRSENRSLQQQVQVLEQRARIQEMLRDADTRSKKK